MRSDGRNLVFTCWGVVYPLEIYQPAVFSWISETSTVWYDCQMLFDVISIPTHPSLLAEVRYLDPRHSLKHQTSGGIWMSRVYKTFKCSIRYNQIIIYIELFECLYINIWINMQKSVIQMFTQVPKTNSFLKSPSMWYPFFNAPPRTVIIQRSHVSWMPWWLSTFWVFMIALIHSLKLT